VVGVDHRRQLLTSQWAVNGLAQNIPGAAGFHIHNRVAIPSKSKDLIIQFAFKNTCSPDILCFGNHPATEALLAPSL